MTNTADGARALPRTNPNHWIGVTADDIPQGWMDDMVKRLFDVLNRSMIELESAAVPVAGESSTDEKKRKALLDDSARKTRIANEMQQALQRLTDMENKRVTTRNTRIEARNYDDARRELKRRVDEALADRDAARDHRKPQ